MPLSGGAGKKTRAVWEMTEGANWVCCSVEHDEVNERGSVWEKGLTVAENQSVGQIIPHKPDHFLT